MEGKAIKKGDIFVSDSLAAVASCNVTSVDDGSTFEISLKEFGEDFSICYINLDINVIYHGESHLFSGELEYGD